jgi:hypothetical protein
MVNYQLHPLQVNPQTGEPFLRLKSHEHIIITPPRLSDAPFLPPILNDPLVHKWLTHPPYPYLPEHAEFWLTIITTASNAVLRELEQAKDTRSQRTVDECPVRFLREVKEDGTDIFLGDIAFIRCPWMELAGTGVNWEQKDVLTEENSRLERGDPKIVWSVGGVCSWLTLFHDHNPYINISFRLSCPQSSWSGYYVRCVCDIIT